MLVPSSLKIIELGVGSFALKSYLAENVGAAKVFAFINNDKKINTVSLMKCFNNFISKTSYNIGKCIQEFKLFIFGRKYEVEWVVSNII
jgi:tRNA A58 N-methylase Trm61